MLPRPRLFAKSQAAACAQNWPCEVRFCVLTARVIRITIHSKRRHAALARSRRQSQSRAAGRHGKHSAGKATRATAPCTAGRHEGAILTCDNARMCAVARSRGQSQPHVQPDGMGNTAPEKRRAPQPHAQPDGMMALFRLVTMRECAQSPEAAGSHSPAQPDGMRARSQLVIMRKCAQSPRHAAYQSVSKAHI